MQSDRVLITFVILPGIFSLKSLKSLAKYMRELTNDNCVISLCDISVLSFIRIVVAQHVLKQEITTFYREFTIKISLNYYQDWYSFKHYLNHLAGIKTRPEEKENTYVSDHPRKKNGLVGRLFITFHVTSRFST